MMTLTTPGLLFPAISLLFPAISLLFPAISLLLLAYTNRFLVLAQLIRELNSKEDSKGAPIIKGQIDNLRKRIYLIRKMQVWGVIAFILCTLSMLALFIKIEYLGIILFGSSLSAFILSLLYSLYEIHNMKFIFQSMR